MAKPFTVTTAADTDVSSAVHHQALRSVTRKVVSVSLVTAGLFAAAAIAHAATAPETSMDQVGSQKGSTTPAASNSANQGVTPNEPATVQSGQSNVSSSVSQSVMNGISSDPRVSVTVNGESVPVTPNTGTQTVTDDANGTTTINLQTSSNGSNNGSSYTNLNVSTNSYGSTDSSTNSQTLMNGVPMR